MPLIIKEADIQIACNDYLILLSKKYNFRHFHVPNEGKRSIWLHNRMKRMGLKSGCPDIIIEYPEGRILYMELKTKKEGYQIIKSCGLYNLKLWVHHIL